jgi:hypothetical protein
LSEMNWIIEKALQPGPRAAGRSCGHLRRQMLSASRNVDCDAM